MTKTPTRPWFLWSWCPRAHTYTGRVAYNIYSGGGTGQGKMAKITPIKINLQFPSTNISTITSPGWSWSSPQHRWLKPPVAQWIGELIKYTTNQLFKLIAMPAYSCSSSSQTLAGLGQKCLKSSWGDLRPAQWHTEKWCETAEWSNWAHSPHSKEQKSMGP